ncbi:(2Fe-2S)-binding protein [Conexibacter arvalis]|uniref:Sarcosine oxidase subunit alpha n=1 Tax=Conexibacter arvalis TaxID=912552 RepID=A0A840I8I2_9ACTN|nr:(2Fe-2S)-binding protein [Conexibacter arvalis]MBB4660581.1 sarcosine oxidase subunit alpha [Conexibacter arvalis]
MSGPERIERHPVLGEVGGRGEPVRFSFDGRPLGGRAGEPVGVALLAAGIRALRRSRAGEPRGIHCAIGQCMECRVEIDGLGTRRACLTPLRDGMVVRTHRDPGSADG